MVPANKLFAGTYSVSGEAFFMENNTIFRCLTAVLVISIHSSAAWASNEKPLPAAWRTAVVLKAVTDTVPPANNGQPENKNNSQVKTNEIIKEVPKSRKQEKPMPVATTNIKPVTVKPKIIVKPVIKIH